MGWRFRSGDPESDVDMRSSRAVGFAKSTQTAGEMNNPWASPCLEDEDGTRVWGSQL